MKKALRKKIAAVGMVTFAFAVTVALVAGPAASQTTELHFSVIERETGYFKLVDTGRKGPSGRHDP